MSFEYWAGTRREFLRGGLAAGIGMALASMPVLAEESPSKLPAITKPIPSTGERLPVVGLGTNAYGVAAPEEIAARREVLQQLPLDFIQVDYSIENRGADAEILPLARDKGVAVLINVPLGGRRGNLLTKVAGKPLPGWASDIDVTSWAQLLLKYNISHPAVTAVIPGTTKLAHLRDNQLAGRGRLPDAATRKRIEQLWETV
jgi:aryl-alcohol dehydrogenase-like predicted oxidoreductase